MSEETYAMKKVKKRIDEEQGPYIDFRCGRDGVWYVTLDGYFEQDDVLEVCEALKEANDE